MRSKISSKLIFVVQFKALAYSTGFPSTPGLGNTDRWFVLYVCYFPVTLETNTSPPTLPPPSFLMLSQRVHGGDTWRKRFASATCGITSNSFWKKLRRLRSVPKQVWEERALLMDERRRQNKTPGSRHPTEGSQRDCQGKVRHHLQWISVLLLQSGADYPAAKRATSPMVNTAMFRKFVQQLNVCRIPEE